VADDGLKSKAQLSRWVRIGSAYARSLPPKTDSPKAPATWVWEVSPPPPHWTAPEDRREPSRILADHSSPPARWWAFHVTIGGCFAYRW
jgi:hypothetical protein